MIGQPNKALRMPFEWSRKHSQSKFSQQILTKHLANQNNKKDSKNNFFPFSYLFSETKRHHEEESHQTLKLQVKKFQNANPRMRSSKVSSGEFSPIPN